MGDVLQSAEVDSLVLPEALGRHVAVVLDDLSEYLRRQHLLLAFRVAKFLPLSELFLVMLLPPPLFFFEGLLRKVRLHLDCKHFS